jgi:adenylate cyclase
MLLEYPDYADTVRKIFEEEDENKAGRLNQLNEQLNGFTDEIKDADPATKKTLSDSIEELKKRIEKLGRNDLLQNLTPRLDGARKEYAALDNADMRQKKWREIVDLKRMMKATKQEYLDNYSIDINNLKKELQGGGGNEKLERLRQLELTHKAMDLVIRVEDLADSIVLSGLTAAGSSDIGAIPLHKAYARVGTYHNTINTIVQKQYINKVPMVLNFIIMLAIAVVMGFIIQRLDAKKSLIAILGIFIVLNLAVILVFDFLHIWLQQLGIVLSMILPSIAIVGIKFMKEETQKRYIKGAFSFYLSPSVIEEIIKDPEALELGGEDREITIFFSDVRSFSTISEKLTAQQLVKRLNEYLTEMTDIILKYNGTVDKYIGDAIMAFYGAPVVMKDHPLRACMAVIEMKKRLRELQEKWRKAGLDELHARMGVHSGKATVGNMGSRTRMDYTAMGDAVNLASRLEGANKFYDTNAMISGSTYEGVKDQVDARNLDIIRVVGKTEPVSIYELLGKKGTLPDKIYDMLEKYNQGREFFINQDWKEARQMFKQGLKIVSDDGPCKIYVERCDNYIKNPPKRGWDGVYVLKGK